MKISGEDTADAIRSWAKDEVSKGATVRYELGRFIFGVSSASGATLIGLERLSSSPTLDGWFGLALIMLLASALIALRLAVPAVTQMGLGHDLFDLHEQHIQRVRNLSWMWFSVWALALVIGGKAVSG